MPQFINPFTSIIPKKKLTHEELINAIRQDLAAEEEAVHLYLAHAAATNNALAKKVLKSVAKEEIVHAGEFNRLINILSKGQEEKYLIKGAMEVDGEIGRKRKTVKKAIVVKKR